MSLIVKRDYFNGLAAQWDGLPAPPDAPARVAEFAARAVPGGCRRVLDVGCGTGIVLPYAARSGRQVVELDLSENMLAENRRKFGAAAALYVCADAARVPFRSSVFDAVVCFGVLPHIPAIDVALRNLVRTLAPGGTIAIGHLMGSTQLNEFHAQLGPAVQHDHLPPASQVARTLAAAGLEPVAEEERADWYFVQYRRPADHR
jgi:ubiquinone/menaquinone biosynthesis C-methylase UbiE